MWLSKRDSSLLKSVIEIYISTHKPVGSETLAGISSLSCSTIRKELQKLESYGFIYKANKSSGRIPTNRGLKHFLKEQAQTIRQSSDTLIIPRITDTDFSNISDNFLSILATDNQNIGFIFLNSILDLNFTKINFVKVGAHRILMVLQSINTWTFSKIFTTYENYSEVDLKNWGNILNREFKGKTIKNTFKIIRNRLFKQKEKYIKIYKELYFLLKNKDLMSAELFCKGTLNLIDSDIINPKKVKKLLETIENKVLLSAFLNDILHSHKKQPNVLFGADTGLSELEGFIMILSNFYNSNNPIGNIGIIGPKFLPYKHTIPQVELFSSYISKHLSKTVMEV